MPVCVCVVYICQCIISWRVWYISLRDIDNCATCFSSVQCVVFMYSFFLRSLFLTFLFYCLLRLCVNVKGFSFSIGRLHASLTHRQSPTCGTLRGPLPGIRWLSAVKCSSYLSKKKTIRQITGHLFRQFNIISEKVQQSHKRYIYSHSLSQCTV